MLVANALLAVDSPDTAVFLSYTSMLQHRPNSSDIKCCTVLFVLEGQGGGPMPPQFWWLAIFFVR